MFKPFKAPSNNHQGFGQGDGAEVSTVKEFIDGANSYFAALFGREPAAAPAPSNDDAAREAAAALAEGMDDATKRIDELEHALANVQMKYDALAEIVGKLAVADPTPALFGSAGVGNSADVGSSVPQPPAHPHPDDKPPSPPAVLGAE